MIKTIFVLCLSSFFGILWANEKAVIESQPEILFQYNKLQKGQKKFALQVDFNKAVMHLSKNEFEKAIALFETTATILKIPSFLNIGIAYYKMGSMKNAKIYLDKIYKLKVDIKHNVYSYMSACYYLYKITDNYDYIDRIINIAKKEKKLNEHAKRLVADAYILLKEYKKAIKVLDSMTFALDLKKAILYLKLKDYVQATLHLDKAKDQTVNQNTLNKVLWLMVYKDLKTNNLELLLEHVAMISERKESFNTNLEMPLKMVFNPRKFTSKEYLEQITKFDLNRRIDFIFYFAPFIFSENKEIFYDSSKGFIFGSKQNIESLENMVDYNAKFLAVIKDDPIVREYKLKDVLQIDTKSYVYYNLALSYAHVHDFANAHHYFTKAYKLNPGNKLFSAMTIISAIRINKTITDKAYIEKNLVKKGGLYEYFGLKLYKMIINPAMKTKLPKASTKYQRTIFYKSLAFLDNVEEEGMAKDDPLLVEHPRDPLVYLMNLTIREENQSDYQYFSTIQDNLPLKYNNNFLSGPLVVTNYYVDLLKAMGVFKNADFSLGKENSPSYLRSVALRDLHFNKPESTIKILEYLQDKYKLEDKYTLYMIVAAMLEAGKYNDASVQISLIKAILNDDGADFLTGVQLIQDLKLKSVPQYFKAPYKDSLIDFEIVGLDQYLESL
ncbi:MAG: tetratricopeptide repeat protein [Campylobacterota bacterium]|nr:tetratricopeptide repeat protein [Campylobacterota bacterium]